jgi:pectinesterase
MENLIQGRMKMNLILLISFFAALTNSSLLAQKNLSEMSWSEVVYKQPDSWYGSEEAISVAENVLLYQRNIGGWPKNTPMHKPLSETEKEKLLQLKTSTDDVTIDNGATLLEMIYLSKVYNHTQAEKYRNGFLKGLDYILEAQYENGGWPQFYPLRKGYYTHITFNDNATINVLKLLKEISSGSQKYRFVTDDVVLAGVKQALEKGIDCILKTQFVQNGVLTVWCAQHDEITLLPAKARAYELPSLSGSESAGIVDFLMSLENPSPEIIKAVKAAVAWFDKVKITGYKVEEFTNSEGKKDRRLIADKNAPALWARFYDLENNRPFFCDRDGIKKYSFDEIGYERRNGYSWYSNSAQKIMDKYPEWEKKWNAAK